MTRGTGGVDAACRGLVRWTALLLVVVGCDRGPAPRHSAEAFMARRELAGKVAEVAEEANRNEDFALEAAAWQVLIDLWPDLPEARIGGAWHEALSRSRRVLGYQASLAFTRRRGQMLEDRLSQAGHQLEALEGALRPIATARPARWPAELTHATEAALQGALCGGL